MKTNSKIKRSLVVLMAIAMFLAYTPVLSYALTEEAEGGNEVVEDTAEDIAAPETVTEDIAAPEAETEDMAAPEAETEESDELTKDSETAAPEEVPAADVQADSVTVEELLAGLEPAEGEADLLELEAYESKAASTDAESTNVIKAEDLRYFGSLRYDTAIKVAERYKEISGAKFKNVIVADGRNFPDALSGGYLAKVKNAPILLVEPSVEKKIADYISENIASTGKVYILGGTGAVSSSFEKKIENKKLTAVRLGGKTRYDTNLKILKAAGVKAEDILVCTGNGYADSLSASAVGKPILLVGDALTDTQKKYIKSLSTKQFYLIGGTGVVKPAILTGLKSLGNYNIQRLWGQTRYETSTAVAKVFFPKSKTVVLAFAQNFPDGLSGGPLAMLENAPIVLTDSKTTAAAKEYVESSGAFRSITLGGTPLISVEAVRKIMGRKAPYIKGDKKYEITKVGETAEITTMSNYGTKYAVQDSNIIEITSKKTTYDEKGEPIEKYTIKGKKAGTAVLILTDKYSGLVTKSIPIIVVDREAAVSLIKKSDQYYVRTKYDTSHDSVIVFRYPEKNYNYTFNFRDARLINNNTSLADTVQAYSEAAMYKDMHDDVPAFNIDSVNVGANHGNPNFIKCVCSHSLTESDIGTVWSDGTYGYTIVQVSSEFLILGSLDSNGRLTVRSPQRLTRKGTTLTVTSTSSIQMRRSAINRKIEILDDHGDNISNGGGGAFTKIIEKYDICDQSKMLSWLTAHAGKCTNDSYYDDAIPYKLASIRNIYMFNSNSSMTVQHTITARETITISRLYGPMTMEFHSNNSDSDYGYIPLSNEFATPTEIDYSRNMHVTPSAEGVPYRFYIMSNTGDGKGYFLHLIDGSEAGDADTRATLKPFARFRASNNKFYSYLAQDVALTSGRSLSVAYGMGLYEKTSNQTVNSCFRLFDGTWIVAMDWHNSFSGQVSLPDELIGGHISVIEKTNSVTVKNEYVGDKGIKIDCSGYGYCVLRVVV